MTLSRRFAGQLAHPRGLGGRVLGQAMDFANRRPLRLALAALDLQPGERVLDAGCGTGAALAVLRRSGALHCSGIDQSAAMIAAARQRLGPDVPLAVTTIEDLLHLGWPAFDAVLALNVLYFADTGGRMIAALRHALRRGGRLVAYATHRHTMERWRFARAGLHRLYDPHGLEAALVEGGFARSSISVKDCEVAPGIRGLIAHAER